MNSLKVPSLQSLIESDHGSNDSLLAESLQLDIEELDDEEYSIPALNSIPTLENILTDLDGDSDFGGGSVGGVPGQSSTTATPTPSMADDSNFPKLGTILRHVVLQGVSSQVGSAVDRVNSGLASSVAISSRMIAVGTSHGHILAFDSQQTLRWCCQDHTAQGAVSAIDFNADSSRLLAGFARGLIVMIDTRSGDTMRAMHDVITPNSGVLNINWTELPTAALCSDSGGSVWCLTFTRKLGIRGADSRCIFSGARGEVCAIAPLCFGDVGNQLSGNCVAAMATLTKFVVVTVKPRLKVIKYRPLIGSPKCLPLLAWQMVLIQRANESRTVDPVLCAAHGNTVYFHQLCIRDGLLLLVFLRQIVLDYNLLALHWLGPKTIATIDTNEILHLHDIRSNRELENIDMAGSRLVYGSAQFKGYATGGNVSPALALAGTYACYNSVKAQDNRIYILGGRSLHSISVRSWSDRISHLVSNQRWNDAFSLALDGFRSASVERSTRRAFARERILKLIDEYLLATPRSPELCLEAAMNCIVGVQEFDLLWQELWDRLPKPDNYLAFLSEQIERNRISSISPIVAQALCDYWMRYDPDRLEELILLLDWRCLDLHQTLKAVRKAKLFRAQIYLNTQALGDYCASLTDLIPMVLGEDRRLGNYILVYISSCLAGRGYPNGDIDPKLIATVKHEVLRCLTSIHSNGAPDSERSYPYLRTLLKFNTRDTLNVLSLAFQEKEFRGELGQSHRQRIVNILLEIMNPDEAIEWPDIGCLLNFIAQQISARSLPDDPLILDQVVGHLKTAATEHESKRQHAEREQAWLELLVNDCLLHITMGDQLRSARAAKCYRVVEYLLEKRKCYEDILPCYLEDEFRHVELWAYLRRHAKHEERVILDQLFAHFEHILRIDAVELTRIVVDCFAGHIPQLLQLLDPNEAESFRFMQQLDEQNFTFETEDSERFVMLLCRFDTEQVEGYLRRNANYRIESALGVVRAFQLADSIIYLLEKQGNYEEAFGVAMERLTDAPESEAETRALELSQLCTRATDVLSPKEAQRLWFAVIDTVLLRPDLSQITRSILHAASKYVDLSEMVQRIMLATRSENSGNFGDIRPILVGMLSNSKYETFLLKTTARVLGDDLHSKLANSESVTGRGLAVKCVRCVNCRNSLTGHDVRIFGSCGHAVHESCAQTPSGDQLEKCPWCGSSAKDGQFASAVISPKTGTIHVQTNTSHSVLQVDAPPRIGIGG